MDEISETKIAYYIGEEKCPYVIKVNIHPGLITLKDFKAAINKPGYKFFFRSEDDDFGVVKEEIRDDSCILPVSDNRVVAWLVPSEDGQQCSSSNQSEKSFRDDVSISKRSDVGGSSSSHHHRPVMNDDASSVCSSRRGTASSHHQQQQQFHNNSNQLQQQHEMMNSGGQPSNNAMMHQNRYGSQSTLMSSDIDASSYDSRDDMSDYSTLSETTASSRFKLRDRRRERKKRRPKRGSDTTSTYSSSITDSSLSLNILTVQLQMGKQEKYNFLGISIVGQTNDNGDGGIYIGSIMKGGAVAADGRIEPGDMLLQVNDVNFENMSNEEAVKVLRDIVHQPGPITLTVAKCWDPIPDRNYFVPKNEPVRPIDPAVWASQTIPAQGFSGVSPPYSTNLESSSASSLPESERYLNDMPLSVNTEMSHVVKHLRKHNSGLDVKTRMWLKITIPNAFIGSDLIDWLQQRIDGLQERRAARKYASSLLKAGYIRHTVNKLTFSEQCYYVFGEYTGGGNRADISVAADSNNSNSDRDSDTLGPLPTTGSAIAPPWAAIQPTPPPQQQTTPGVQPPATSSFTSYHHQQQQQGGYMPGQAVASSPHLHHTLNFPIAPQSYTQQQLVSDIETLSMDGSQRQVGMGGGGGGGSIYGSQASSGGSDRESRCSVRSANGGGGGSIVGHPLPPPLSSNNQHQNWQQTSSSTRLRMTPTSSYNSLNNRRHLANSSNQQQQANPLASNSIIYQQN